MKIGPLHAFGKGDFSNLQYTPFGAKLSIASKVHRQSYDKPLHLR